jgi:hypothetical protein
MWKGLDGGWECHIFPHVRERGKTGWGHALFWDESLQVDLLVQ